MKDWVMRAQLFKSCKMTPYVLIVIESTFPHIWYIRKYGVYTVIYGVYTVYGNSMYGLGQPYVCALDIRHLRQLWQITAIEY